MQAGLPSLRSAGLNQTVADVVERSVRWAQSEIGCDECGTIDCDIDHSLDGEL